MIRCGDKVKVVNLYQEGASNMWGGHDDITIFKDKEGIVTSIISPDTAYEQYGLEFEHWGAQVARERTGYIFNKDEIELVNQKEEND